MTKGDVFQELLDEWGALKELDSDRKESSLKFIHNQYEKWLKKYKEAK